MQHPSIDDPNRPDDSLDRHGPEPAPSSGRPTRRGRTLKRQRLFVDAYRAGGVLRQAAAQAGVTRQAAWKWRQDPVVREAVARARQDHLDGLAATRLDHVRDVMHEFEQHLETLDDRTLHAAASTQWEASRRTRGASAPRRGGMPQTSVRVSPLQLLRRQLRFLKAYTAYGTIRAACHAVGIERATVRHWRAGDPTFERLFLDAQEEHREVIYGALFQRGVTGTLTPVYRRGRPIGHVRTYDHRALGQLVRWRFPQVSARRRPPGAPTPPAPTTGTPPPVLVPLDRLSPEELALLQKIHGPAGPPVVERLG